MSTISSAVSLPLPTHALQPRASQFADATPEKSGPSQASSPRPMDRRQVYLLKVCRGLMMYGAPTARLEAYMKASAAVLDLRQQSFYIPGLMLLSFNDTSWTATDVHIVRCAQALNLTKLYKVRSIYKDVVHRRVDVEGAIRQLDEVFESKDRFHPWVRVLVYGLASMCIGPVSYSARPIDLPMIFVLGCLLGFSDLILSTNSELYSHVYETFCTIIIAFLARALGSINGGGTFCFSALCQASLVMILPGFIVTNSALELQSKNMVAGGVRLVYGVVFILFLSFGITIGATIYGAIDGSAISATTCSNPWPFWWQIIFVPLFTWAWIVVNQAPWHKMPAMVLLTTAGWVVNHFSGERFSANTTISQALGALTIGTLANLYSRIGSEFAAALLHPAIFIQVPGSLAANGGIISGVQSADSVNRNTTTTTTSSQQHLELLNAGYSMVEFAIGITVGLSVSALVVYPFRKRKGKSGLFTF